MEAIWREFNEFFVSSWEYFISELPKFAVALLVFIAFYIAFKFIKIPFYNKLNKIIKDQLVFGFIEQILTIGKWVFLVIIFLNIIGKSNWITSILGAAGISAFIIGFAFRDLGENFLAGIMLAFKRPFKLGDTIKTNGIEGVIREIDLREIHIKTFDGKDVYIPNGQLLKNPLYNYTIDGFMRQECLFSVDYDADLDLACKIILDEMNKLEDVLQKDKSPSVVVSIVNPPVVTIRCHYWIDTYQRILSGSEIKSRIYKNSILQLKRSGIDTPNSSIEVKQ